MAFEEYSVTASTRNCGRVMRMGRAWQQPDAVNPNLKGVQMNDLTLLDRIASYGPVSLAIIYFLGSLCVATATFAQNVVVENGEIYYRTSTGKVRYPADYTGVAVTFAFTDRNPFPNGRFADARISCADQTADSVERAPAVVPQANGVPGFWTALKRGESYSFSWMYYFGGKSQFAAWTVPSNAPRCIGLAITLDLQGNAARIAVTPPPSSSQSTSAPGAPPASVVQPQLGGEAEAAPHSITGKFFGKDADGVIHYWDFDTAGSFLHRWIAAGSLGHVGNSERGTYTLSGSVLTLTVTKSATSFSQASTSHADGTVYGSGARTESNTRIARVTFGSGAPAENEVLLRIEGVPLKARHY